MIVYSRRRITLTIALLVLFLSGACRVPDVERRDPISGEISGAGVEQPVRVVRDQNGVAHIIARNDRDLFFAVGYTMAQDRWLQMDEYRRAGSGRLSELFGSPLKYRDYDLPHIDIALRTFRFDQEAREGAANLDPESRALLEAFVRGVNRYLEDGAGTLAIYQALDTEPQPWTLEDCFTASGVMGLAMTMSSFFEEYYLERIRIERGEEVRDLFVPAYPDDAVIITRDQTLLSGNPASWLPGPLSGLGSNNWAVAGKRTVSGLPLLCNDPHVPNSTIPTFWWHCHIKSPGYDAMGMMFAGYPCFGAAQNGKLAWVLTNVMADYVDVWREKLNPEDPDQYLADGQWVPFEKEEGQVRVNGKKPVKYVMRSSRHGTVIDEKLLGWKVASEPGEVLVLRYSDMDMARFFRGYQAMARAKNFDEWLAGARDMAWGPFAWNHVYADAKGNIAYWATGRFPIRPDNQGYVARKGWEEGQGWQGHVPFEQNPHLVNPKKGYLVSANNRTELPGYPYYITVDYVSPSRATVITELIEGKDRLDVDDMKRIQYDVSVYSARRLVPIILADVEGSDSRSLALASTILREWRDQGYQATADSRGTCLYEVFLQKFPTAVFEDDLKDVGAGMGMVGLYSAALDRIIDDPQSDWYDDQGTRKKETRPDVVKKCLVESINYLRKNLGLNPKKWQWGELSTLTISPSFISIPGFTSKSSRGPYPLPGTGETVRAADQIFLGPLGFRGFVGPSTHLIIDFRNPRQALFNTTAGMSENESGGRYDNLMPAWLAGEYRVMSMDEDEFRRGMMGELVLAP